MHLGQHVVLSLPLVLYAVLDSVLHSPFTPLMKIAFVGTGVMGKSMVANLLKSGHEVTVYTRTKAKADDLFALGARWAASPASPGCSR